MGHARRTRAEQELGTLCRATLVGAVAAAGSAAGRSLQGVWSPPQWPGRGEEILASGFKAQVAWASLLPMAICLLGQGALISFSCNTEAHKLPGSPAPSPAVRESGFDSRNACGLTQIGNCPVSRHRRTRGRWAAGPSAWGGHFL